MKSGFTPPPPVKKPQEDIFALDGFRRIDHLDMPRISGLSTSTWKEIFPPLREVVLRRSAVHHFRRRMEINDAIYRAIAEIDLQQLQYGEDSRSHIFRALMPCFPNFGLIEGLPSKEIIRFTDAVLSGARKWRQILTAEDPFVEAWFAAAIEPVDGRCVISGEVLSDWCPENPDSYALPEYAEHFNAAGAVLCAMTLDRARELEEISKRRPPDLQLDPNIDPDNPQTYMDFEPSIEPVQAYQIAPRSGTGLNLAASA